MLRGTFPSRTVQFRLPHNIRSFLETSFSIEFSPCDGDLRVAIRLVLAPLSIICRRLKALQLNSIVVVVVIAFTGRRIFQVIHVDLGLE